MRNRLPYEIALLAVVLLGSCDRPLQLDASQALDLADAAQANARTALAQNEEQESEIDELERKVSDLESRLSDAESTLSKNARIANENTRLMDDRWDAYKRHVH